MDFTVKRNPENATTNFSHYVHLFVTCFSGRLGSRVKRLLASCPSVLLSAHMYQRGSLWANFRENWYWGTIMKICRENTNLVTIGHTSWRPKYILMSPATLNRHKKFSLPLTFYKVVRTAKDVKILRELATMWRYTPSASPVLSYTGLFEMIVGVLTTF